MSGEVWQERGTERKDSMARVFRGKVARRCCIFSSLFYAGMLSL